MKDGILSVTSVSTAGVSVLSTVNEVIQILAGTVSIVAGLIVVIPWLAKRMKR